MQRDAMATIDLQAVGPARLVLAIGAARDYTTEERFEARQAGDALPFRVLDEAHGGRLHVLDVEAGQVRIEYSVRVHGTAEPPPPDALAEIRYLRPSRYSESDLLQPVAEAQFGGLAGKELLAAVSDWVAGQLSYTAGSSLPTDGAARTLLARRGVCRDYAHLVVAFLRALDVPARVASVYAPGLSPMDFHAVAEAAVDGAWHVVDATHLAPRGTMIRIATGRDAADTAWLSSHFAPVRFLSMEVTAIADSLPDDDWSEPAVLR